MQSNKFIKLKTFNKLTVEEMISQSESFNTTVQRRRTIREFSAESVPEQVIKNCVIAAGSAPSGANKQPWEFVIIKNLETKKKIREMAEIEEKEFYNGKAPDEWLRDLEPFETNEKKPFLESAPYLIAIFEKKYEEINGERFKNYYTRESVGLATGILITALHFSGLATLTHTPSPMNFLNEILNRPKSEKPFLLLVVGYPKDGVEVPNITRKPFEKIAKII